MADDILSQEEVDALLKGVTCETDPVDEPEQCYWKYNFAKQERLVRGRMPALEIIHERFARLFRIELWNLIEQYVEISVGSVHVMKYSEWVRNLVVPTCINVTHFESLGGQGLVVFDPNIIFLMTDHVFGGDGRYHMRVEGRDFTDVEKIVIEKLVESFYKSYTESFKDVHDLKKMAQSRMEMNTQFVNIATPSETIVAVSFSIDIGSGGGDVHIMLPYNLIEPIKDVLYNGYMPEYHRDNKQRIQTDDIEIEISIRTNPTLVSVEKIALLRVGDVLGYPGNDVEVKAGDVKLFETNFDKEHYNKHTIVRKV